MKIKEIARQLRRDIPAIYLALRNPKTSIIAKLFGSITVIYALSPIDFIPDFVPILGYLDDLILLPLLVFITIKFIPKEILIECRNQAIHLWENGKPKQWYYAIPIVLIWVIIIFKLLIFII